MWNKIGLLVVFSVMLFGCNRDETFRPTTSVASQLPVTQAPAPTTPSAPSGGGGGTTSPGFQPQLPSGYNYSYTAFLPIDYYMRAYGYQSYWQQMWYQWQIYAYQVGTTQYDFNTFWFQFCPQSWYGTQLWNFYQYVDQTYYYWVQPYTSIPTNVNPSYFWQYYVGYGYGGNTCNICH